LSRRYEFYGRENPAHGPGLGGWDIDFVVAVDEVDRVVTALEAVGFGADRHEWSANFRGRSQISLQLSVEDFYREFPGRAVPADVHWILLRVASLEDTLAGKIKAWRTPE